MKMFSFYLIFYFLIRRNKFLNVLEMFVIFLPLSVGEIKFMDLHNWFVWKCGKNFCETSIPTLGRLSFPLVSLDQKEVAVVL